ncbi:MAG: thioesterase [Flavobacteriaceae bacterium]
MKRPKLFCLHFGGGNQFSLLKLKKSISPSVNVVFLEVPGRGKRLREPLLTNLDSMALDIYKQVKSHLKNDEDYILFGHSLGGMLIFLVSRLLRDNYDKMPIHLIPSGVKAPKFNNDGKIIFHQLTESNFKKELFNLGGIPKEVMADKELLDFFLPILKADFTAIETYKYVESEPMDIPITALSGLEENISVEDLKKWNNETTKEVEIMQFKGDHFFVLNELDTIGNLINMIFKRDLVELE